MPPGRFCWLSALLLAWAVPVFAQSNATAAAGQMPPGHGIKCQKADGSPCGDPEIADLNQDVTDAKTTVSDSQSTVSDTQQNVSDAKQVGGDAQQVSADMKKPLANPKQTVSDAKQAVSDVKSAVSDAQQTKSDAQQAAQDVNQNLQDVKKTFKDLAGIKSLALKALDGSMNCSQNDGSACNDTQTKALQTQAAQKSPPLTISREVDQPSN
jgi:F0F1-type ATP synthase membrane subunit b/b'